MTALYQKPAGRSSKFLFRYDLFSNTYHEITDNSYLINNIDGQWVRQTSFGRAGIGADLAWVAYPYNSQSDFLYPKAFTFVRHDLTKKLYHQLDLEVSWRNYLKARAIGDTLGSLQESRRHDRQAGAGYLIGGSLGTKASMSVRGKFLANDSNASFQDYYDYHSYRGDVGLACKLTSKDVAVSSVFFVRKSYRHRLTVDASERQWNDLYSASVSWRHSFSKAGVLSVSYRYLENFSNEPSARYIDQIMSAGWTYNF